MKIFVTGSTGFVGSAFCQDALHKDYAVVGVGRRISHLLKETENFQYMRADTTMTGVWQEQIPKVNAVVNMAGESILRRWTDRTRARVWDSRILSTRNVVAAMAPGQTLISFSATGYYGNRGPELLDENAPGGTGFLSELCHAWEQEALGAPKGVRVVICRLGVVLGNGGALNKMVPFFRMGMGGRLGNGHQWFPWIHLEDVLGAIHFLLRTPTVDGVVHFTGPTPVTNLAFTKALGLALGVPTIMPVPKLVLSMLFGEASSVLLNSQRVVSNRLSVAGYAFRFDTVQEAIRAVLTD